MLRSVLLLILGTAWTAYMAANTVIFSYLSPNENQSHKVARLWAKILLLMTSVKVQIVGKDNIAEGQSHVFMVNHQSVFDIFVLLAHIPVQFRWIVKKELFKVPVFGQAMRNAGYIEIDRRNHEKALKSLDVAAQKIREGKSVMTFPEGTRSKDGNIKPFKQGMFYLAMQSGVPIIPVTIIGTVGIMPKDSLRVNPKKVIMIIDKPIDVRDYSIENRGELIMRVQNIITKNYEQGGGLSAQNRSD
jgi:1-acyl-sn-glycerol-3-phosphate acyltransferase